jgi:hypothetical protein
MAAILVVPVRELPLVYRCIVKWVVGECIFKQDSMLRKRMLGQSRKTAILLPFLQHASEDEDTEDVCCAMQLVQVGL